jgi:hypothetical protein
LHIKAAPAGGGLIDSVSKAMLNAEDKNLRITRDPRLLDFDVETSIQNRLGERGSICVWLEGSSHFERSSYGRDSISAMRKSPRGARRRAISMKGAVASAPATRPILLEKT